MSVYKHAVNQCKLWSSLRKINTGMGNKRAYTHSLAWRIDTTKLSEKKSTSTKRMCAKQKHFQVCVCMRSLTKCQWNCVQNAFIHRQTNSPTNWLTDTENEWMTVWMSAWRRQRRRWVGTWALGTIHLSRRWWHGMKAIARAHTNNENKMKARQSTPFPKLFHIEWPQLSPRFLFSMLRIYLSRFFNLSHSFEYTYFFL